jgi:5-methylcytosine-specific restriction enzyme subunit McrC
MILPISEGPINNVEAGKLSTEQALALRNKYPTYVEVVQDFADGHFQLRSRGYIGYLVVSRDFALEITPKVHIANVFRMLEYAHHPVYFPKGQVHVETIDDLAEALALILAESVLERARRGLYASYVDEKGLLPFVRGRIDINSTLQKMQWPSSALCCAYEDHTVDVEENRILLWTLHYLRKHLQNEKPRQRVRRAYQALNGAVSLEQKEARDCIDRSYNRLNDDYQQMHLLCSFFLQHLSPQIIAGKYPFLPFTLYMPTLFQTFVRQWLTKHTPDNIIAIYHEEHVKPEPAPLTFKMDIILKDIVTDRVIAVLDTKYKADESKSKASNPSNEDVYQIATYAYQMKTPKAILIYPSGRSESYEANIRDISVQTVVFDISQDDIGAKKFCKDLAIALET